MCVSCFPDSCRLDRCPKMKVLEPPVAFLCDKCGESVHVGELEDANCFETPDKQMICSACVDTMTVKEALVFLGCMVIFE